MAEQLRQPMGAGHSSHRDVVGPEGYERSLLDRSIQHVNWYFEQAFGYDKSPLTHIGTSTTDHGGYSAC